MPFNLQAPFQPTGDQMVTIHLFVEGIHKDYKHQVLLGVTGRQDVHDRERHQERATSPRWSSRTTRRWRRSFTRSSRVSSRNAVEYFVSYFDYYQPEAYIPRTDTFIEKDSEHQRRDRAHATGRHQRSLPRHDVIVVASVSCIYGLATRRSTGGW